jgi:hypothetical protein
VLLDASYTGSGDAPCFHTGKHAILRKIHDNNYFLVERSLREKISILGVVPYVQNTYNEVSYLAKQCLQLVAFYVPGLSHPCSKTELRTTEDRLFTYRWALFQCCILLF